MTASGWRSRITVTPPSGICASPPRNTPSAASLANLGSPRVLRDASHVTSANRIPTAATTRFPNSTNAWNPSSGYGVSPQRGQFSQPRPEPVSRTNAPDVTTTSIAPSESDASLRKRLGDTPWSLDSRGMAAGRLPLWVWILPLASGVAAVLAWTVWCHTERGTWIGAVLILGSGVLVLSFVHESLPHRRGFLGWLGRWGLALLAGAVTTGVVFLAAGLGYYLRCPPF